VVVLAVQAVAVQAVGVLMELQELLIQVVVEVVLETVALLNVMAVAVVLELLS
jgi:hypothetical protein